MRKVLFILTIILLFSVSIHAQVKFGVKGGANISKVYLNENILGKGNINGFQVGTVVEFMSPSLIGVDAAVLYSQRGLSLEEVNGSEWKAFANYIDVPVNLKFKIGISAAKLYLTAGPYVSFKISGDDSIDGIYNQVMQQWDAQSFQAGINVGAGVELFENFQVGANYEVGLTENYSGKDFETENRTLSLSAAVFF